jgi:hypothetical protein
MWSPYKGRCGYDAGEEGDQGSTGLDHRVPVE